MNLIIAEVSAGSFTTPIIAVAIVLAFVFLGYVVSSRYKRVAPNVIGVFYGMKYSYIDADNKVHKRGFRTVTGGGSILWPLFERYQEMSMAAFQVDVKEAKIPSAKNVRVSIEGVATCRISNAPEDQHNAVQAFLGKSPQEINEFVGQILKGHIRSIIGKLEVHELLRERATFNEMVVKESAEEFRKLGLQILTLVIQDVSDEHGYIEALGKQEIANTMRDANIQVAEAEKETAIRVAEAQKETSVKTSNAAREAAEAKAQNDAKIAEAQRQLALQVAANKGLVDAKNAEANLAGELAKASMEKQLKIAQADRDKADAEARVGVEEQERKRKEKELDATVIVAAEAESKAILIRAEAGQKAAQFEAERAAIQAEGQRKAAVTTGQGEAEKRKLQANAEAEATKVTLGAQAEGNRAVALATAEGDKAKLLAAAEGDKAKLVATAEGERLRLNAIAEGKQNALLAEATGTEKLAEALQKMDERGQLILILDRLPGLLEKGGEAGAAIAKEVFGPMGIGLGKIGTINITDLGGGKTTGDALQTLATSIPTAIANFFTQCEARGVDVKPLLSFFKMDGSGLQKMLGMNVGLNPTTIAAAARSANGAPAAPGATDTPTVS
ncbi:MAG: hypothetical protein HZA81_02850 [Candidatus Taylorbacteria bacterium]|nr:hypothetical protein [Candidatus Taylorbacteria bacterium]